jgi:hypothetical protein
VSKKKPRFKYTAVASSVPASFRNRPTGLSVRDLEPPTTWIDASASPTQAPTIGETERTEGYAATAPELAHRILEGSVLISPATLIVLLPVIWLLVVGWIFVQDNGAGALQNLQGMGWFAAKSGVVGVLALIAAGVLHQIGRRTA